MTPPAIAADLCTAMECTPGLTDIEARLADLDVEGVEQELIFPQRLFGLFMFGEMMNRAEVFGAYNQMWSSDYPHQESTFGYTRSAIQAVFDATSVEKAQLILGKTARELFKMG